jgi:cytochrome c oxidase subunit II
MLERRPTDAACHLHAGRAPAADRIARLMGPIPRRRARLLALTLLATGLALVLAAALAATAGADAVTPDAGPSKNAVDIDTLYKIVFYTGLAVISLVWGVLFYSLFRFRARRGRRAPQIFGNAPLELGWTLAAAAIVTVIAVITLFMVPDIKNPPASGSTSLAEAHRQNAAIDQPPPPDAAKALHVTVSGQQYIWRYQYPNGAVSFQQMVVPVDTTVTLDIKANDVVHSWWIPKLGGKADAVPGYTNKTWFKATSTGTFTGQCTEYCGFGHAVMSAKVTVVEQQQYKTWVENQKKLIKQAQQEAVKMRKQFQRAGT